ncbi:MAG: Slp family lipoprotein, partial [Gammaproteobacteria bacterium]
DTSRPRGTSQAEGWRARVLNRVSSKASVLALVIASSVFLGCIRPPPALEGGPFADITPKFVHPGVVGKRVRWGGRITASRIHEHESCFDMVAAELDRTARPWRENPTQGAFSVCLSGFYDPAIYQTGRWVTVIGTVRALESPKTGDDSVLRPKVEGETIHLWPEWRPYRRWDRGGWDPFWDYDC